MSKTANFWCYYINCFYCCEHDIKPYSTLTALIEERDVNVSYPLLEEMGGWPVLGDSPGGNWTEANYDLTDLLVSLIKYNNKPLIEFYAYTDLKNSTTRVLYVSS